MAQFATDAFTGTEGALLSTYSANWALHPSYSGTAEIASNRARGTTTTSSLYYNSGTPASADYSVSADLFFKEANGSDAYTSVVGRVNTSANTFYMARYAGGTNDGWQLYKAIAGTFSQLGGTIAQAITDETSHNIKLEMVGSSIKLYKDGEGTATISATDSDISASGKSGIRLVGTSSDTTGVHLDNFSADDVASGITGTGSLTTADATASGTGVIGHIGTGALTNATTNASGTGAVTSSGTVTGTGALTTGAITASGAGKLTHTGTGALSSNVVSISGTGKLTHTGTGALSVADATLSGSGFLGTGVTGTGAFAIGNVLVSGTANRIGWDMAANAAGTWAEAAGGAGTWTDKIQASGTWTNL